MDRIACKEDIERLVEAFGFLPFFRCPIEGLSVEEHCPPELWFTEEEGPWEWKGPVVRTRNCIYGKFFGGKAGFVSKAFLPDFVNFRRDGYDFDSRCDEGLTTYRDKGVYAAVEARGAVLSKELKRAAGFKKGGTSGFETVITRLQMQGYLTVSDFVYMTDRTGKPYGWGVAEYATVEHLFGYDFVTSAYRRDPSESYARMEAHLSRVTNASKEEIARLMK